MESVGKVSRYMNKNVTGQIKNKELKVIYFPIKEMLAYFFAKPLHDILFIKHWSYALGIHAYEMKIVYEII